MEQGGETACYAMIFGRCVFFFLYIIYMYIIWEGSGGVRKLLKNKKKPPKKNRIVFFIFLYIYFLLSLYIYVDTSFPPFPYL